MLCVPTSLFVPTSSQGQGVDRRNTLPVIALASCLAAASFAPAAEPPAAKPNLASYFADQEKGMKAGGARRIPITTPKGSFTVWTKRFGNNPRIKLLLLHGGPAAT